MQPFEVKLDYRGSSWCTVPVELGHDEIGDAIEPVYVLSAELTELFTTTGLEAPKPVPVLRADHQIAQKLHAVSAPGSERARDLIDLQLLEKYEPIDLAKVAVTCRRLFAFRKQQSWPPLIAAGSGWDSLYQEASADLPVIPTLTEAISWAKDFIGRIDQVRK